MIIKICAIGLTAAFLALTIKKTSSSASFAISAAAGAVILLILLPSIARITREISDIAHIGSIPEEYIKLLLKVLGIGYITDFSAAAAKDSGEASMAQKIEFAGKISIMAISMPLFTTLINLITGLLPKG